MGVIFVLIGVFMVFDNIVADSMVNSGLVGVTFAFVGVFVIIINVLKTPVIHKISYLSFLNITAPCKRACAVLRC